MAVKHNVLEYEDRPFNIDCMTVMLRVLEKIRNEPQTMPQGQDLIKLCEAIVHGLGLLVVPCEPNAIATFVKDVRSIQDFLANVCQTGPFKEQLIFATLKALYNGISNPAKKPGAAMSVVLQLVDSNYLPSAVNLILDAGHSDTSLEQALLTLCGWLTCWAKTPNLGECVLVFIQGLESQKRYDILIDVTLNMIERFFNLLMLPAYRTSIGPVVICMLTHVQGTPEAFHKIIPLMPNMTARLKESECGRVFLQDIANVCKALTEHFPGYDALYEHLEEVYKCSPPSANYRTYLECTPWSDNINQTIVQRSDVEKVGLNNLGNTCYMNSVLQALFMTKLFSNTVLQYSFEQRWPLITKLQTLFAMLQFSQRASLSPSDILQLARPPGFQPGHQHDSSEFLGYLLDILHEQEKSLLNVHNGRGMVSTDTEMKQQPSPATESGSGDFQNPPPPTVVQRAFGGRAETIYKCHACGTESIRADNFRDLQLSFPSDFTDGQSVQSLLDYYLKPERLCDDNQYHCERCNGLSDAERVFRVIQNPSRLVLTLKHFHYDSASQQRIKLLHRVQYDTVLMLNGAQYELYAAVIHCGTSVDSGHYYTYARDFATQVWYKFNDCCVTRCAESDLSNLRPPETPYILFYSRQDIIEPNPISRHELSPALETILKREIAELEAQQRNRRRIETNAQRFVKRDDPPPPGCGGGGSFLTNDRFVC